MNLSASIIDQRLRGIQDEIRERANVELSIKDPEKLKSLAFVFLCVKTVLDLETEETIDCLVEGGNDFGVDAIHIGEVVDEEFTVTLFQGKYKRDLKGNSNFPENGIKALINAIRHIFDPSAKVETIKERLKIKVEEARSIINDGYYPRVRAIACNNGLKWKEEAQEDIERFNAGDRVSWEHVNHEVLINALHQVTPIEETLRLTGKAVVEDMNFSRVCVGRIPVTEIADLMKKHGEGLLERNIRRYLGLHGNRVNEAIRGTLFSEKPENFYFFNNGLTLVCSDFNYNALQSSDYQIKLENLQIVNGGQTCITILKTLEEMQAKGRSLPQNASVMVRVYKLPRNNEDIVLQITHATNSQNPVDLKDLRSNDEKQRLLAISIGELGFKYRRKRMDAPIRNDITSGTAAEAILAIWRNCPHQAKFFTREHFGKLYPTIFTESLNGAQTITAVLLYRIAENHRKRPAENDPLFVRYASCFIAMQMGKRVLRDLGVFLSGLDHQNFSTAHQLIEQRGEPYFREGVEDIDWALKELYGDQEISMQQLSATFRRGDLILKLKNKEV